MVWLAAASLLVLVPSIADVAGQLGGRGAQTLCRRPRRRIRGSSA
jgi:hypothetical protein